MDQDPPSKDEGGLKTRGEKLAEQGQLEQALSCWSAALALNPQDFEIYEMQAQVLLELKEDFKAIKAAEKCVLLAPNFVYGYLTLGRAQINLGELEMALETFKKATQFSANEEIEEELRRTAELISLRGSNNAKTF